MENPYECLHLNPHNFAATFVFIIHLPIVMVNSKMKNKNHIFALHNKTLEKYLKNVHPQN